MKKNDTMGYVAYALMLMVAILVGLLVIRPDFAAATNLQINSILLVLISIVVGIVLTAILIELGHMIGAKMGHYTITSWICLGLGYKRDKNGKASFSAGNFDGLTGETVVTPNDVKKANPHPMIIMPLIFILLEVVAAVVGMVLGANRVATTGDTSYYWIKIASETILTVACMILIYDIFPTPLDSKNDGYLLTILNSKTNREAYNEMLFAEDHLARGLPPVKTPVYDNVTDFTASVNDVTLYEDLDKGDFKGALDILEKTIACKDHVSSSIYKNAVAQKVAIVIDTDSHEEAEKYFIGLSLEIKKYLASLSSAPAIRAYVLANGLIEQSQSETEAALEKADSVLHKLPKEKRIIEKRMLKAAVAKVCQAHPDWDLSAYSMAPKKAEDKKSEETKPEEPKEKDDNK
jgi:hypothetical protein